MCDNALIAKKKFIKISLMQGQELKQRRKKLGLTQRGLAVWLAVTTHKVINWENERSSIPQAVEQRLEKIEVRLNKIKNQPNF